METVHFCLLLFLNGRSFSAFSLEGFGVFRVLRLQVFKFTLGHCVEECGKALNGVVRMAIVGLESCTPKSASATIFPDKRPYRLRRMDPPWRWTKFGPSCRALLMVNPCAHRVNLGSLSEAIEGPILDKQSAKHQSFSLTLLRWI